MSTSQASAAEPPDWGGILENLKSDVENPAALAGAIAALRSGAEIGEAVSDLSALRKELDGVEIRFLLSEALHQAMNFAEAESLLREGIGERDVLTRLNRVGKQNLPRAQERRRIYACNSIVSLQGKRVLELGGVLPLEFVRAFRPASWISLDLGAEERNEGWYRVVQGDAADTPLPTESCDVVFSSSAFEHIGDLKGCLEEVARVLVPSGIVFSEFSPIWSGAQGHHLRGIARDVLRKADAWPLPDWLHLMLTPSEMRSYLAERLPAEEIHHVERWLYRRTSLNRLCYEDYVYLFHNTGLSVVRIDRREGPAPDAKTLRALRTRQPGRSSFQVKGMRVVLQKPQRSAGAGSLEPAQPTEEAAVQQAVKELLDEEARGISRFSGKAQRRVYLVHLKGRDVVLKVLGVRKPRAISCDFAVQAMSLVDVPTARVLGARGRSKGQNRFFEFPFLIQERVDGVPLDSWILEAKPNRKDVVEVMRNLGAMLDRIHSIRTPSGYGLINDAGEGRYKTWLGYLQHNSVRLKNRRKVKILDLTFLSKSGTLSATHLDKIRHLFRRHTDLLAIGKPFLLHNDLTLKNVFVDPSSLRIAAIIDLHNALAGDPAYELARFYYFYRGRGYYEHLLEGYQRTGADFGRRQRLYFVHVLLEKLEWINGREKQFPGRLERDLATLQDTLDQI
jgi:Ser/Thr protein kinase RdoA (MazF antagonist)/SAM-dependent methyltransferase